MNVSRRWFIGGMASFGAFGGARLFAADDFPADTKVAVTVTPLNWFLRKGTPLTAEV